MRYFVVAILLCSFLTGCGGAATLPPFQGHWRKYEDPAGHFVKFDGNEITLGDKEDSYSGAYSFQEANAEEPLYDVDVKIPGHQESFQLYYEEDTISLIFAGDDQRSGLYEVIFDADFKPRGTELP